MADDAGHSLVAVFALFFSLCNGGEKVEDLGEIGDLTMVRRMRGNKWFWEGGGE